MIATNNGKEMIEHCSTDETKRTMYLLGTHSFAHTSWTYKL